MTFTVEDALLSPMGFAVLSGAGLLKGTKDEVVHVHTTTAAYSSTNEIDLTDSLNEGEVICSTAPIFVTVAESDGSITGELIEGLTVSADGKKLVGKVDSGMTLFVDYYVEATTLFRRQSDGVDMPAEITLPNVKIQSNFTFSMASSGDPSEQMRLAA